MKLTVNSKTLATALQVAQRVINSRNVLPVLDNFLIEIGDGKMFITASDLENTVVKTIDIESKESIKFLTIAKIFTDAITALSEQPIEIVIEDSHLIIHSSTGKYQFPIDKKVDEYPTIEEKPCNFNLLAKSEMLLDGINAVSFACANDELRPVMNGINIEIESDKITYVATDAHKLIKQVITIGEDTDYKTGSVIMSKKASNLLKNVLKADMDLSFEVSDKYIKVVLEGIKYYFRTIEGRYPNYNAVIPTESKYNVIIDRKELLSALKRVAVFSNKASSLVRLSFDGTALDISAQDIDFSISAKETIMCQYAGGKLDIGFKIDFLIEILSNINGEQINISMTDSSRAAIFTPILKDEGKDVLMLLMPMILND